jgi:hypothetical protein
VRGVQVGQGVLDIGIGDKNLIHVRGDGLPVDGLGRLEIGRKSPALKDGERDAGVMAATRLRQSKRLGGRRRSGSRRRLSE